MLLSSKKSLRELHIKAVGATAKTGDPLLHPLSVVEFTLVAEVGGFQVVLQSCQ